MKLGFDIDEVVCDLTSCLTKYIKENYGCDWALEDWHDYDLGDYDYTGCGDEETNERIIADLWDRSYDFGFLNTCQPIEGAVKALKSLKKRGHTLHYITTREKGKEHLTISWLREHSIPFDTVHHVGHGGEKGFVGRALNLDFFVDDLEKNLKSMLRYKKRWKKGLVLLDKPWNRTLYDGSKFIKLNNWKQIIRHIGIHNR